LIAILLLSCLLKVIIDLVGEEEEVASESMDEGDIVLGILFVGEALR